MSDSRSPSENSGRLSSRVPVSGPSGKENVTPRTHFITLVPRLRRFLAPSAGVGMIPTMDWNAREGRACRLQDSAADHQSTAGSNRFGEALQPLIVQLET